MLMTQSHENILIDLSVFCGDWFFGFEKQDFIKLELPRNSYQWNDALTTIWAVMTHSSILNNFILRHDCTRLSGVIAGGI